MKLAESNLLDHWGIKAVETAVKPHTLKEKKGQSGIGPHSPGDCKSRPIGGCGEQRGDGGGSEVRTPSGRRVRTLDMMSSSSLRAL